MEDVEQATVRQNELREKLRALIKDGAYSAQWIARHAGVSASSLSRFIGENPGNLSGENVKKLYSYAKTSGLWSYVNRPVEFDTEDPLYFAALKFFRVHGNDELVNSLYGDFVFFQASNFIPEHIVVGKFAFQRKNENGSLLFFEEQRSSPSSSLLSLVERFSGYAFKKGNCIYCISTESVSSETMRFYLFTQYHEQFSEDAREITYLEGLGSGIYKSNSFYSKKITAIKVAPESKLLDKLGIYSSKSLLEEFSDLEWVLQSLT